MCSQDKRGRTCLQLVAGHPNWEEPPNPPPKLYKAHSLPKFSKPKNQGPK